MATLARDRGAGAAARPRAARRASTPARTTARRRAAARWCCSGRTGRASGPRFRASPEYRDGAPDPLDRWSERVIGGAGRGASAREALFPFGGPPWQPFTAWARRSGEAWESPVGLLVHARAGLFVSYRGALALPARLDAAAAGAAALRRLRRALPRRLPGRGAGRRRATTSPACHGYLDTAPGGDCLGARLRGAPGLPGRAGAAARGAIGLPHGGLSWQAEAMRRLILMRHAKSSWADPGQRDLDRPLNKRGRRAPALIGGWLKAQGLPARTRRWSRPRAAPRRPGPAWSPPPAPRRPTYVPELYHAAPETMLAVLRGGAGRRTAC